MDATNNYWGSREEPKEAEVNQDAAADRADVVGDVAVDPFLPRPPGRSSGKGNGN